MTAPFALDFPRTPAAWLRAKSALLVWDLQQCVGERAVELDRVLEATASLVELAAAAGVMVVFTRHVGRRWVEEDLAWRYLQWRAAGEPSQMQEPRCRDGRRDNEIYDALKPPPGAIVIAKHRPSLFAGTSAEELFRGRGIATLVIAGIATDRGVLSTAREAVYRGFHPIVVAEATTSFSSNAHRKGLEEAARVGSVVNLGDVRNAWVAVSGRMSNDDQ